jgi:outer membrane lipoprotein-sorting protein
MSLSYSITRRLFLFLTGGVLAKFGLEQTAVSEAGEKDLSAAEILEQMAKVYAKCKTYQDTGCVTIVFTIADGQHTDKRPFSTAFVRPDRFRFEFKSSFDGSKWQRYIVWAEGKDVRTWWDIQPGVEKQSSLSMGLAGPTGVSGGSAHTIPVLLMPDSIGGERLTDLAELKRLEDAKLGGVDCYRIKGKSVIKVDPGERERLRKEVKKVTGKGATTSKRGPETLWIDKSSFLLRRIDAEYQLGSSRAESTTTYEPLLDVRLADKKLEFDPPGK